MADDAARRREIRRRKILEGSEARLKRITGSISPKLSDELHSNNHTEENTIEKEGCNQSCESDQVEPHSFEYSEEDFRTVGSSDFSNDRHTNLNHEGSHLLNGQFSEGEFPATNGSFSRAGSSENYTFPKKVSDAESRSFRKTRGDTRRNSTCTQMMIETFQFSTISLSVLRPWIVCLGAFILRIYLLITHTLPYSETIYLPLIMLELAFLAWSQLESQMFSKPVESSIISGILMLCGVSERRISNIVAVFNFVNCVVLDFAIYTFLFVLTHYIFEISI